MKRWHHWGRPTAKVNGIARGNMGFKARVTVRLSKLNNRCGQRVYTVAKFKYHHYDYHAPRCRSTLARGRGA